MNSKEKGDRGEKIAAEYLTEKGYTIIERNFRSKWGEIDIVAVKADSLSFIEVKSWNKYSDSELEYSINRGKKNRIIKTAKVFLNRNPLYYKKRPAFDVIYLGEKDGQIRHIESAFRGEEI